MSVYVVVSLFSMSGFQTIGSAVSYSWPPGSVAPRSLEFQTTGSLRTLWISLVYCLCDMKVSGHPDQSFQQLRGKTHSRFSHLQAPKTHGNTQNISKYSRSTAVLPNFLQNISKPSKQQTLMLGILWFLNVSHVLGAVGRNCCCQLVTDGLFFG